MTSELRSRKAGIRLVEDPNQKELMGITRQARSKEEAEKLREKFAAAKAKKEYIKAPNAGGSLPTNWIHAEHAEAEIELVSSGADLRHFPESGLPYPFKHATTTPPIPSPSSTPSLMTIICILFISRLGSAIWNNITDCDEVFNYWEPMHYLTHNSIGLQTWEYSPEYALRSWSFLLPSTVWIWSGAAETTGSALLSLLPSLSLTTSEPSFWVASVYRSNPKLALFFGTRFFLSCVICLGCEVYWIDSIRRRWGSSIARWTLVFHAILPGFWIASSAYLPSTFAMSMLMVAFGGWLRGHSAVAPIFGVGAAVLLGWPFVGLIALPMALILIWDYGLLRLIGIGSLVAMILLGPSIWYDSNVYGEPVFAAWNIVKYNALGGGSGGGSELYGVEPWNFYVKNLVLNFNFVTFIFLGAPSLFFLYAMVCRRGDWAQVVEVIFRLLGPYLWFGFMSLQAHKEERFLFPIYPLIALSAAVAVHSALELASLIMLENMSMSLPKRKTILNTLSISFVVIITCFSVARIYALTYNYGAPVPVYAALSSTISLSDSYTGSEVKVCVGDEWYRFPSHYLLPDTSGNGLPVRLGFVKQRFKDQLPQYFTADPSESRDGFNDLNKSEESRFVVNVEAECTYFVGLDQGYSDDFRLNVDNESWKEIISHPFLSASESSGLSRSFYLPLASWQNKNTFRDYYVLENQNLL